MPPESLNDELNQRRRRFAHAAILRLSVALAYLTLEAVGAVSHGLAGGVFVGLAFTLYGSLLLLYRGHARVFEAAKPILAADTVGMLLLAVLSSEAIGLSLLMFAFLLVEASLLHRTRETLIVTAVWVVFFVVWLWSGAASDIRFSLASFLFTLVLGGGFAYYFTFQGQRREKRIGDVFRRASGQSEAHMVVASEAALRELTKWLGCSRAVLAFWDSSSDYFVLCQYPPQRSPGDPPPVAFDSRQEWACFVGARLDFHAADVSLADEAGRKQAREFDLHPYVIQTLEVRNAVGCGLHYDGKAIGRLLLVNNKRGSSARQQRRLQEASHLFRDAVRHLLVVRRTEHEAYERERIRIAHDLHDGPLQSIISFEMRLNIIRKLRERDPAQASRELDALYELSRKLVSEMRTFVHRMRPIDGDESSLLAAARRMIESFQKESGVAVTLMAGQNGELAAPKNVSGEVLKIAREALHNVYKHAGATHVLFALEKKNNEIHLSIDDNGKGYRFGGRFGLDELDVMSIGPRSIRQRVRGLGGAMTIESNPGHGSNLHVTVPLSGSSQG